MLRRASASLTLALLCALPASADPASDDFSRVQATRHAVGAFTGKDATPAQLRKGVARLEDSLRYLGQPDVDALAVGSPSLYYRGHDVRLDLARLYARLGMNDQALDTLDAMQRFAWLPDKLTGLTGDAAFAGLRATPRFQHIVKNGEIAGRLWQEPAGNVPYQETLSVEQRIAGLTAFWSEARANFVYFDHVPDLDWNQAYLDFLPKVMAARTTRDYYDVLMRMSPLLKDGHTGVYAPAALNDHFYAHPPLVTALVQGRVMIERVESPSLAGRVHPGDEIVAIDGLPVRRYAEERVGPYVNSSTPQDRSARMYTYQLLAGDVHDAVALTLRDHTGTERKETLARGGYGDVQPPAPRAFRMLPGGVAYIALDSFADDAGVVAFEQALPAILAARALVIDVRHNGGGSSDYGWKVLSYLSAQPIAMAPQYVRADDTLQRAQGTTMVAWRRISSNNAAPFVLAHPRIFSGKVAVLTGPRTYSAAEDFVVAFNGLRRGITVGEATGGSTGQPLMIDLPGGGRARICVKRDLTVDGHDFVGIGLQPAVAASQTVEALRAGRDAVLERALQALAQP